MDGTSFARSESENRWGGRQLSRRCFLALSLVSAGASGLVACSPSPPASPPGAVKTAPSGGAPATQAATPAKQLATEIRIGTPSLADTLDPHGTLSVSQFATARLVFDALVTWDGKGDTIVPQLASEWKRIDPLTLEFKLRDDVKFSNGEDFTAETVKFNVERLMNSTDPLHANTKSRMGSLTTAEVVNPTTVRVKTKEPDPILLNRMTMLFMVPAKYTAGGADLKNKPIGTGSFKATEFITRQRAVFEAWDGSWRGKSTVKTAVFQEIPELATLLAALKRGEIDIATSPPPDQVAGLQREGFKVNTISSNSCLICSFLPNHPLMRDKRVREAMNLAVNKEEMLQTIQAGFGKVPQGQLLQPGLLGFRDDLKPVPYDLDRAKALLRDAGAAGPEILVTTVAATKPYTDAVVGYLVAAGARARADLIEFSLLTTPLNRGWDRPMVAWTTDYFHLRDFDAVAARFTKDWPAPHFDNEEFTQLYRASRSELDEKKRAEQIGRMAQIMRDEFAVLFLMWRDLPTLYSKNIARLDRSYDGSYPLWRTEKEA